MEVPKGPNNTTQYYERLRTEIAVNVNFAIFASVTVERYCTTRARGNRKRVEKKVGVEKARRKS